MHPAAVFVYRQRTPWFPSDLQRGDEAAATAIVERLRTRHTARKRLNPEFATTGPVPVGAASAATGLPVKRRG
jgi:hypothetical protein